MNKSTSVLIVLLCALAIQGLWAQGQTLDEQTPDQQMLRSIYDMALTHGKAYDWLDHLSNEIGGRLSGSLEAEKAVQYTKEVMQEI